MIFGGIGRYANDLVTRSAILRLDNISFSKSTLTQLEAIKVQNPMETKKLDEQIEVKKTDLANTSTADDKQSTQDSTPTNMTKPKPVYE